MFRISTNEEKCLDAVDVDADDDDEKVSFLLLLYVFVYSTKKLEMSKKEAADEKFSLNNFRLKTGKGKST